MDQHLAMERIGRRRARFWRDLFYVFLRRPFALAGIMFGRTISVAFRERVMLAVSRVNGCSFCTWFHSSKALKAGVDDTEIKALLAASYGDVPPDELVAVLYAEHWAETQGDTDREARDRFEASYDAHTQDRILLTIRFINAMNHYMITLEHLLPGKKIKG